MEYNGRFYGKELIDWAIRDAETKHKGQIAVIIGDRYANMHPGDGQHCPLALQNFIPKTPEGEKAAMSFIVDGVGYDYWGIPWERMEGIADLQETISVILAEGEVVWAASAADKARFYALKERMFRNLSDPRYVCRIIARRLEDAMEIYKNMAFEEDTGMLRMGARFVGIYLGDAIAAANGTYLKCGETGTDDPSPILRSLPDVPEGYVEMQGKLCAAASGEEIVSLCREMILKVRKFLQARMPKAQEEKPSPESIAGWYEEMIYTWRRIQYFCDRGDAPNAFGWGGYLQQDMGMLGDLLTDGERNILRNFDAEQLSAFAQRCEEARALVYNRLKAHGVPIREYDTLEAFLADTEEEQHGEEV